MMEEKDCFSSVLILLSLDSLEKDDILFRAIYLIRHNSYNFIICQMLKIEIHCYMQSLIGV